MLHPNTKHSHSPFQVLSSSDNRGSQSFMRSNKRSHSRSSRPLTLWKRTSSISETPSSLAKYCFQHCKHTHAPNTGNIQNGRGRKSGTSFIEIPSFLPPVRKNLPCRLNGSLIFKIIRAYRYNVADESRVFPGYFFMGLYEFFKKNRNKCMRCVRFVFASGHFRVSRTVTLHRKCLRIFIVFLILDCDIRIYPFFSYFQSPLSYIIYCW